jgi:hypothetical protein
VGQSAHDETVTVIVTDSVTGEVRMARASVWDWTEGNFSCDCNRAPLFTGGHGPPECAGCRRYWVTAVDPMPEGYQLSGFNFWYEPQTLTPEK